MQRALYPVVGQDAIYFVSRGARAEPCPGLDPGSIQCSCVVRPETEEAWVVFVRFVAVIIPKSDNRPDVVCSRLTARPPNISRFGYRFKNKS